MVGGSTQRTVQYSLYSLLYNIIQNYIRHIILQQCQDCYTVPHKVYTLNQVTLQYQLYSTILTYRTVTFVTIYTHTSHLKYIIVCHTFSNTTVQFCLGTVYIFRNSTHYTYFTCSLFSPLTAALPQYCLAQPEAVCLSGKERKREKEEGRGRGKCFSAEIRTFLPPLYCTYCTNSQYTLGLHLTITQYCSYICTAPNY